jgi:hypothetical protein
LLRYVIAPPTDAIGLVQEVPPIAQSSFRVLVNRDDDGLHVVEYPSRAAMWRTSASALIQGGLSALGSYHLSASRDIGAASFHQVFQLSPLARHQDLRGRAATAVYIGGPNVTTANGFPIPGVAGSSLTLAATTAIYGIVATGSQAVATLACQ